jgi:hypothetical protein
VVPASQPKTSCNLTLKVRNSGDFSSTVGANPPFRVVNSPFMLKCHCVALLAIPGPLNHTWTAASHMQVMLACSKGKLAWVIRSLTLIIPCRKPLSFTISA